MLHGHPGHARQRLIALELEAGQVAKDEQLRVAGHGKIRLHDNSASLSTSAPAFSANSRPRGEACTPAVHRIVRVSRCSVWSPLWIITAIGSTSVTFAPVWNSTPSRVSAAAALAESLGGKEGQIRSPPSTSTMRALRGSIWRNSRLKVRWARSARQPLNSTPDGPPPATTNVSQARRVSGSAATSAASNADRTRRRICSASAIDCNEGADFCHSSWPK